MLAVLTILMAPCSRHHRRDLSDDQRAQIFIHVNKESDSWQIEQNKIAAAANAKRSASQKGVPKAKAMERSTTKCSTTLPASERNKTQYAKAKAAGVNAGAIARAEALERAAAMRRAKSEVSNLDPTHRRSLEAILCDRIWAFGLELALTTAEANDQPQHAGHERHGEKQSAEAVSWRPPREPRESDQRRGS